MRHPPGLLATTHVIELALAIGYFMIDVTPGRHHNPRRSQFWVALRRVLRSQLPCETSQKFPEGGGPPDPSSGCHGKLRTQRKFDS